MDTDTAERLSRLEKRLDEFDRLLELLCRLAQCHPVGRKMLAWIGKENGR